MSLPYYDAEPHPFEGRALDGGKAVIAAARAISALYGYDNCVYLYARPLPHGGGIYLDKPTTIALIAHLQAQVDACPDRPLHPLIYPFPRHTDTADYATATRRVSDALYELDRLKAVAAGGSGDDQ